MAKKDLIAINMPAGAVEYVAGGEVLWFRKAFPSEWKGTVMVLTVFKPLYSVDSIDEIKKKLEANEVPLASLKPPVGRIEMVINAGKVREIEKPNKSIHHEKARAVLVFNPKLRLAIRETPKEAQRLLKAATSKDVPIG
jgi:hypothetical protein